MPSWDDEYESEEMLSDIVDMDYCPDTWEDPDFNGLARGCTEVCRVHKLVPRKCVVFGGSDTGRRFYMCSVANKVHQENYANIKSGVADELHSLKKEVSVLRAELVMRKNLQMTQAEVMKGKQKAWDEEKEAMRQENKKLEYNLYDLLKVTDGNKQKLKSIKAICDE
ncbi:unnamed protein product [Alopecurus aequalis]